MDKILLIDIDSKMPNLALKKIEKYHLDKNNQVIWNFPLSQKDCDAIYVSCIFDWNKNKAKEWEGIAEIGGTGYSLDICLPTEIENIKPHINLGFTTRGCIRNCPFCVVPKKEGKTRIVGDLLDLWDGKSKDIMLMDNNILALPEHFRLICEQAQKNRIRIDFNQGLDHRLLNKDIVSILKQTPHKEYRFSWDNINSEQTVLNAINLLKENGINHSMWYCLVGFNTTPEEDIYRLNTLKELKQDVYVQRYKYKKDYSQFYIALARWGNQHHIFKSMSFEEFCKRSYYFRCKKCGSEKLIEKVEIVPFTTA